MPQHPAPQPAWQVWLAPASLTIVAVVFVLSPTGSDVPRPGPAVLAAGALSTAPPRAMMQDPPTVKLGGFERDCQDCHFIFDRDEKVGRRLRQHTDVVLDHGRNNRCLGCHDQHDRNRLTLGGDESVGFADSDQLCSSCHGPTWRDWDRGIHGRASGSWDIGSGQRGKLTCVQCHDPHSPAFATLAPLPGPNTLRMGERYGGTPHATESPLMQGYKTKPAAGGGH